MRPNNEETVDQIKSGCPSIVNIEHLQRHDQVITYIHWILHKHYEIPHTEKWYKHAPEPVEGNNIMVLWDFAVLSDRKIDANRPGIIKHFKEQTYTMLDVSVAADKNILLKEFDKVSK